MQTLTIKIIMKFLSIYGRFKKNSNNRDEIDITGRAAGGYLITPG